MAHPDSRTRYLGGRRIRAPWGAWAGVAATVALVGTLVVACSDSGNPAQLGGGIGGDSGPGDPCAVPNEGCKCNGEGVSVKCGQVTAHSGDYVTCSEGTRTCKAGTWGACVGDHSVFKSVGSIGPVVHTLDYGMPVSCMSNPCDPNCQNFPDNSNGVDAGPGIVPIDGGFTLADAMVPPDAITVSCQGIQCQVVNCAVGGTAGTVLTGTVYDPASLQPIYDAIVAVPLGAVPTPPTGVPRPAGGCGGVMLPNVVTYTNTAHDGTFTLTGVPAGNNIPLLIQAGQWQRVVNVNVTACTTKNISTSCNGLNNYAGSAACLTRLPRTKAEGNIPKVGFASGGLDAMECLLYRMGIDSSEFTDENGNGRVNLFLNGGAQLAAGANHDVSYLLGFTCPGGFCPTATAATGCVNTNITNGGFETGNVNGWAFVGWGSMNNNAPHSGNWSVRLGATSPTNDSSLTQTFTAPAGAAVLQFWYRMTCQDGVFWDWSTASLQDNTTNTNVTMLPHTCAGNGTTWVPISTPVTPGHSYTLTLAQRDDAPSNDPSWAEWDDVQFCTNPPGSNAPDLTHNYDLIMLPCDGGSEYGPGNRWGSDYDDVGRTNLVNYANLGGRVFSSHWGREWMERPSGAHPAGPFPGVAPWYGDGNTPWGGGSDPLTGHIDATSVRGNDFAQWMNVTVGSSTTFAITPSRFDANANLPAASTRFVYAWSDNNPGAHPGNPDAVMDFTFDTPIGGMPNGRVMYTDMHLASGNPFGVFPNNCPTQGSGLTAQEKAAEYLLFDLGACVGTPVPPVVNIPPVWYNPASVSRVYNPTCNMGQHVVWRFFYWEDSIPPTDAGTPANIVFTAKTATTQAGLGAAPSVTLATVNTTNLAFVGVDVGAALATIPSKSLDFLQLTFTLNPSSDHQTSPTLLAWQLTYDCVDSE